LHINKRTVDVLLTVFLYKEMLNIVKQVESEEVVYLREQNKELHDELVIERAHSREQADKLSNLAVQLTELTLNNQILLGAEQTRTTSPALLIDNGIQKKNKHKRKNKNIIYGKEAELTYT